MSITSNNQPGKPRAPAEPADGRSSMASRQWPHKDFRKSRDEENVFVRIQVCPKKRLSRTNPMTWGWDWDQESYSIGMGLGFLGDDNFKKHNEDVSKEFYGFVGKKKTDSGKNTNRDPWRIHGTGIFTYCTTWMVDFYGIHVGKYTSPMDPMGDIQLAPQVNRSPFDWLSWGLGPA